MSIELFFRHKLAEIDNAIDKACSRVQRHRSEITLVGVTKYVESKVALALHLAGVKDLGESRPQELWQKAKDLPATVNWHQIGHLQTNKIDKTLPLVTLIHSVDSTKLLQAIDKEATKQQRNVNVLLEVNMSREEAKHGFAPEEVDSVIGSLKDLKTTQVQGLMTMAAYSEDPENSRSTFAALRQLRDQMEPNMPSGHSLKHLSMGMSNDFVIAIEEGATLVRIGSILFEGLPDK